MPANDKAGAARYVSRVRRSFSHLQRISKVGWVGPEVHRLSCPEYQEARRWPEPDRDAIALGNFDLVFIALLDDYVDGSVGFPPLHDCLRAEPDKPHPSARN